MRTAAVAAVLALLCTPGALAHPNPQPPPRGASDLVFPSSNALLEGEERLLASTRSLELLVSCTARQENGAAFIGLEVRLVGPDRARLVDGVGYARETNDPVPGEVEWFIIASSEAPTLSRIGTVQAIPDFDFRVGNERLFGTAILARLIGVADRPCGYSLAIRQSGAGNP